MFLLVVNLLFKKIIIPVDKMTSVIHCIIFFLFNFVVHEQATDLCNDAVDWIWVGYLF